MNIDSDSFKYMVPGMIGSVRYGSGRRAFDPQEIVAGKTGTCIEHGAWVGLFTSYAPLDSPRLAVVVIARGDDGRHHFPAAVAGRIYRDLNGRFGTPANMQIAATRASQTENGTPVSKNSLTSENAAASDDEETDEADDNVEANTTKAATTTTTTWTTWGDSRTSPDSKVKRVLMSIPNRTTANTKPAGASKNAAPQTSERR